jgi:hypothetical protein
MVPLFIGLTALCWGSYGPVLHKGQAKMSGSRMRPFLCVGLAYFAIAVLVPLPLLQAFQEGGGWNASGVIWSLAGGAAGAIGALGIIMAFNFGGKPIYVMPLVFGCAPVVNTFTTVWHEGTYGELSSLFCASLMLVIGGAVSVLIFAPRGGKPAGAAEPKGPSKASPERTLEKPERPSEPAPAEPGHVPEDFAATDDEAAEDTIQSEDTSGYSRDG